MPQSISELWNDPTQGLTAADFTRWPGQYALGRLDRNKMAPILQGALDNGDLVLPVYLVGKCSVYETSHGHPTKGFLIDDFVPFAISGTPGASWPRITTMKSKGVLSKRVESRRLPEFNHIELEEIPANPNGYLDLQMSRDGVPTARIGLHWSYGRGTDLGVAHEQAQLISSALATCRNDLFPNGAPMVTGEVTLSPSPEPALTDWSNIDAIKAEWAKQSFDHDQDLLGFQNGMRLAREDSTPAQLFNYAEYMTRGLKHSLMGEDIACDDEIADALERVLLLLERTKIMHEMQYEYRRTLVRLALAITKDKGWQPDDLGGNGRVHANFESPMVRDALRYDPVPPSEVTQRFFASGPK